MKKEKAIIGCIYEGKIDTEGRPHGQGKMVYKVNDEQFKDMRYNGEFVHGVRQGEGCLSFAKQMPNSQTAYEWYSEGDYDCCGRLVHPLHEPGSYRAWVDAWYIMFEGQWENDMPTRPKKQYPGAEPDEETLADARLTAYEAVRELPLTKL